MKKAVILAIVSLFAFVQAANAQFYVGGSVYVSTQFQETTVTHIGLTPDVGYTWGNWCFGSSFNLASTTGRDNFTFTATPYAEYFFWSSGPVSFFVEAGVGLTWGSRFSFNPYVAPGISFKISDHWDVMGHIGRLAYDSIDKTLLFSTTGVGALSLGLYYSF